MNRPSYMDAPVQTGLVNDRSALISLKAPLMGRGIAARLVYERAARLAPSKRLHSRKNRFLGDIKPSTGQNTQYQRHHNSQGNGRIQSRPI